MGTNDSAAESFKVEGLAKATAVDVSNSHACAILTDGSAACWGWNSNGGLGDGSKAKSLAPVTVKDLTSTTSISAGSYFTCALAAQVPSCWGLNSIGQLGNGNTTDSVTHVSLNVENGTAVIATSRGGNHACAVLSASSVKCWGYNYFGQLGNGTPTPSPSTPTATPVTVTGLSGAKALALGNNHSCALLTDGSVKCWGLNGEGELGNASTTSAAVPTGVTGLRDIVKQLGAGGDATCAVLANGAVQCWGAGTVLGSTVDALAPQLAPEW